MTPNDNLYDFYRASPMREGVLCWYPFTPEASVLDKSDGVFADLLNSRCGYVATNAEVGERFDYIVLLDPEDFSADALKELHDSLTPSGRLLLAYENPFALRYWNGKRSPSTGIPYDSLFGHDGRVSKAGLQIRLKQAGFEGQKWYYPLPDHWFAQEIYSESYLPNEFLNQRFVMYMANGDCLQFDERWLYQEIIRGGAFEFMCGAYLVEARMCGEDTGCPVDYAAVTAYREPDKRFATTVRNDGTVRKIPLHPDGSARLSCVLQNHEELAGLGIGILPVRIENGALIMPRIELPTLWDYWAGKLVNSSLNFHEVISHFDQIHDAIYKASVGGKCYWELVPANCFYDGKKDELIFFDQEYYWEDVSPDVAVARAVWSLRYSLVFSADLRTTGWLNQLKARYGLEEHWEELSELADVKTLAEVFGDGRCPLSLATEQAVNQVAQVSRYWRLYPIAERLKGLGFGFPAIYGYGLRGKALKRVLEDCEIKIAAIIDQKFETLSAVDKIPPEITPDVIIVSVLDAREIVADLREKTAIPIYTLEELRHESNT